MWKIKIFILFSMAFFVSVIATPSQGNVKDIPSSLRSKQAEANNNADLVKALSRKDMSLGDPIFIRIFKKEAQLEVWVKSNNQYNLFKSFAICTYSGGLGPKLKEGDGQSPEGFYFVRPTQLNPNSSYHLSFNIGFPNSLDRQLGRTGSYLMIHGSCVSIGCYAMTDGGIEEIWSLAAAALRNGQDYYRVHIFPFRMNKENMERHKSDRWISWWQSLQEGYDHFETHRLPPDVTVKNKKYSFSH